MARFSHHVFICCNQRSADHPRGCCDKTGSEALKTRFKLELKSRGLTPDVRANSAGCLDQCELGPTIVIYPQEIWYGGVQESDVVRIIEETIIGGRVLPDLLFADELLNTKGGRAVPPPAEGTTEANS